MKNSVGFLRPAFLLSGLCALACLPAILVAERLAWSERPLHATQMIACLLCFLTSTAYLLRNRTAPRNSRATAWLASLLSGGYLAFLLWVITRLDFSGM
jgi:hypothetical protein